MNLDRRLILFLLMAVFAVSGCGPTQEPLLTHPDANREDKIPADVSKRNPETDPNSPILHSLDYELPIPLTYPVNTAGAEDSPFILPEGNTLYFFFTPDVRVPAETQLLDGVSGIWVSHRSGGTWGDPQRVWLQDPGKLALDGAVSIQSDELWFASAREEYTGVNMFTAEKINGAWDNWTYVGDRLMKEIEVGEVHLHGDDLYFHSDRPGGEGDYDLWVTARIGDSWSDPVNVEAVNTAERDGWPFISPDGQELWFTRTHQGTPAIFRARRHDGGWGEPELVLSQFAGEPTLDSAGNLYFVHHYFEDGMMIEADIYVAYKR